MIPTLETERLILNGFTLDDGPRVELLAGHKEVAATTANIPHPYPSGAAETWIAGHVAQYSQRNGVVFAIRRKDGEVIGCVSLGGDKHHKRAELGYWMGYDYWNQGFTTEAARACLLFGFEALCLVRITARHLSGNPASGRVMEKIGMKKEGHLRKHFNKNEVFHDIVEYGILREEMAQQESGQTVFR